MTRTQEIKKQLKSEFPGVVFYVSKSDKDYVQVCVGTPDKKIDWEIAQVIQHRCHEISLFKGVSETNKVSDHRFDEISCNTNWII